MPVGTTLGVCLALAGAPAQPPVFVPAQQFTLAWTHSIERVRWEEDYTIIDGQEPRLQAGKARIKGSAAGMEPPPEAVKRDGWYEYQPHQWPDTPLRLTRSGYTPDYDWCEQQTCQPMEDLLPTDGDITLLYPCRQDAQQRP